LDTGICFQALKFSPSCVCSAPFPYRVSSFFPFLTSCPPPPSPSRILSVLSPYDRPRLSSLWLFPPGPRPTGRLKMSTAKSLLPQSTFRSFLPHRPPFISPPSRTRFLQRFCVPFPPSFVTLPLECPWPRRNPNPPLFPFKLLLPPTHDAPILSKVFPRQYRLQAFSPLPSLPLVRWSPQRVSGPRHVPFLRVPPLSFLRLRNSRV